MACVSVSGAVAGMVSFGAAAAPMSRSGAARALFVNVTSFAPAMRSNRTRRAPRIVAMASVSSLPEDMLKKVQESIAVAQEICTGNATSEECVVAWDEVEELSAEAAHRRARAPVSVDPLDQYCEDNPETDECRVYED